jgi:hypothetical protein
VAQTALASGTVLVATPNLWLELNEAGDASPEGGADTLPATAPDAAPDAGDAGPEGGAGIWPAAAPDAGPDAAPAPVVAIVEDDCALSGVKAEHACHVASVLGQNGARPTHCYAAAIGPTLNDPDSGLYIYEPGTTLWQAVQALVGAVDSPPGAQTFVNMSMAPPPEKIPLLACYLYPPTFSQLGDSQQADYLEASAAWWFATIDTLLMVFREHPWAQGQTVLAIAAANWGAPIKPRIDRIETVFGEHGPLGNEELAVLQNNIVIVTTARPQPMPGAWAPFDYVNDDEWTPDLANAVLAANNPWAAYGTSFAAPFALAQVYQRVAAAGGTLTPSAALVALKSDAAAANHLVPFDAGPYPPPPEAGVNDVAPTDIDVSNCPQGSHWGGDAGCVLAFYDPEGQVVSGPLGGAYPWLQTVAWPSLQTSLGLTSAWIPVDATCSFSTTSNAPGESQTTTGQFQAFPAPRICPTYADPDATALGTEGDSDATVSSGSGSVETTATFRAGLTATWPHLPCCDLSQANLNVVVFDAGS